MLPDCLSKRAVGNRRYSQISTVGRYYGATVVVSKALLDLSVSEWTINRGTATDFEGIDFLGSFQGMSQNYVIAWVRETWLGH